MNGLGHFGFLAWLTCWLACCPVKLRNDVDGSALAKSQDLRTAQFMWRRGDLKAYFKHCVGQNLWQYFQPGSDRVALI